MEGVLPHVLHNLQLEVRFVMAKSLLAHRRHLDGMAVRMCTSVLKFSLRIFLYLRDRVCCCSVMEMVFDLKGSCPFNIEVL
jgi:hypothetical protein